VAPSDMLSLVPVHNHCTFRNFLNRSMNRYL
jgi:hypothetical protein